MNVKYTGLKFGKRRMFNSGMNILKDSKSTNNGDADSGLENASDSSQSFCESTPSTDCDDSSSSECEEKSGCHRRVIVMTHQLTNDLKIKNATNSILSAENDYECFSKINLKNICQNSKREDVLQFFETLMTGQCETVDFHKNSDTEKPSWLDEEKFRRGQKFARDHLFCINFAEMVSLYILFAQKSSLGPLIFTGKSDSPFAAFKRYLNTLTKLMSWYTDDVWNDNESQGKKNIKIVRAMHKNVYHDLTNASEDVLTQKTTLGDPSTTALWCPMRDFLVSDFQESVPCPPWNNILEKKICRVVWVNQADMSITQFGFVGLAVTYPEAFGIHLASEEDLDAFLHMWRGLGYLLGIKDEYNYCNGNLKTVRDRTLFFLDVIAKPSLRNVTTDWEHMCRCLTAGISFYLPRVSFEPSLLYLCNVLNIETPRLRAKMNFGSYIVYIIHRMIFYLMKYPKILSWLNDRLYYIIDKVQSAPPEVLNKWESKEFAYMKQPGKCPIRNRLQNT